jgi:hypothetical protein
MRTKGPKQEYYQLSVRFSPERGRLIQDLANKHGRSFSKEVVQLVEEQLLLLEEKGVVYSNSLQERL